MRRLHAGTQPLPQRPLLRSDPTPRKLRSSWNLHPSVLRGEIADDQSLCEWASLRVQCHVADYGFAREVHGGEVDLWREVRGAVCEWVGILEGAEGGLELQGRMGGGGGEGVGDMYTEGEFGGEGALEWMGSVMIFGTCVQ